ncbi:MAG: biopolymer transporter ExbD [Planctomycetaceae bacterium]
MRLPTQNVHRTPLRFNITPLIDVVFLLIIFFLVASHFVRSEQAAAVNLPDASAGQVDSEMAPHRLTVTVQPDGSYSVAGEPADEAAVLLRIEELARTAGAAGVIPEVRIRADKAARYGAVRILVEHCAAHGVRSIRFAVAVSE